MFETSADFPSNLISKSLFFSIVFGKQTTVTYNGRVPSPGRYAFMIHYYQPSQPSFTLEVQVHGGRVWRGKDYGCLKVMIQL